LALQQEFSAAVGTSIYNVLPGVVENTLAIRYPALPAAHPAA
jgi:hypothetical protein